MLISMHKLISDVAHRQTQLPYEISYQRKALKHFPFNLISIIFLLLANAKITVPIRSLVMRIQVITYYEGL